MGVNNNKNYLLDDDELAGGVPGEGVDDGVEGVDDAGALDAVVGADEVLVHRLEPPDVVVRVRHQVHGKLPLHRRRRRRLGPRARVRAHVRRAGSYDLEGPRANSTLWALKTKYTFH